MRLTRGGDFDPAWSPDGGTIFFSHNTPLGTIPVACPQIFRIGTNGRNLRRVTREHGRGHIDPAVSPDGRRIVFTQEVGCESADIVTLEVVDASGRPTGDLSRLPGNTSSGGPWHYGPTWSPGGGRIAFIRVLGPSNTGVFVADLDGSNLRRVTPRGIAAWEPAWSPDGAWIAFVRDEGYPNYDLYVVHPDGTGLRRLTRTKTRESSPAWLPRMPAG
jgi:TolB protein